jgi:hypothetical protein
LVYNTYMKVFLSYALSPLDSPLSARLRAVALAYNIELLLPGVENRQHLPFENKKKIEDSNAILILLSNNPIPYRPASFLQPLTYEEELQSVNAELIEATRLRKPIIALVESPLLIQGLPPNQVIVFNRHDPTQHENLLFQSLSKIRAQKNTDDIVKALGALGLVALGFFALTEFTKEASGQK